MKALIDRALEKSGDADRYSRRMKSNPVLATLGCLPQNLNEISNHQQPWFCHGLAFRMATFCDDTEHVFKQWETLLNLAQQAEGWDREYAHWSSPTDHWAKKWDKFHHFLWLLQCYEYFAEVGYSVSFPATSNNAMPDLLIKRGGQEAIYSECFFYSKWWLREFYFEFLLHKIDEKLSIRRTYNIVYDSSGNPFFSDAQLVAAVGKLGAALSHERLVELQVAAELTSPQEVCEIGGFKILFEGEGEYQPSLNAHGDPTYSLSIYMNEIIAAKKDSNNLEVSRPNILMVNGLGFDFQFSLPGGTVDDNSIPNLPCSLDEVWISACGIDRKLADCQIGLKIRRNGIAGPGF